MTIAMDDAATRVSRYLVTQSGVNCIYGLSLGLGLYFLGVPYPVFWVCWGAYSASFPMREL